MFESLELIIKMLVVVNAVVLAAVTVWLIVYYRHDQRFRHVLPTAVCLLMLWGGTTQGIYIERTEPLSFRMLYYGVAYVVGDIGIIGLITWRYRSDKAGKFPRLQK
jgi:hypothetical protein